MSELPRVAVLLTGGTIDSVGKNRLDNAFYMENKARLEADELFRRVPEIDEIADVELVPFRRITSQAMTDSDWIELDSSVYLRGGEYQSPRLFC
jgi:L-asparaginase